MQALILAGGKGVRLRPYTAVLPKPLMPIGDIPILEIILRQLKNQGVTSVIIAVGYLHHMIEAYFKDGSNHGVSINYSLEEKPLGTAGPIDLVMDQLEEDFLVLNGDLLTSISYRNLYDSHIKNNAAATIATFKRTVDIDFGVLELEENSQLKNYNEKPSFDYRVSMGINVFNKSSIKSLIKHDEYLDIPDLMMHLKTKKQKVFCYQEECEWLDIGRLEDYNVAVDTFEKKKNIFLPDH